MILSIRDYKKRLVVTNGTTNEVIKVPYFEYEDDEAVMVDFSISEIILLRTIQKELNECDSVIVSKTYMKD